MLCLNVSATSLGLRRAACALNRAVVGECSRRWVKPCQRQSTWVLKWKPWSVISRQMTLQRNYLPHTAANMCQNVYAGLLPGGRVVCGSRSLQDTSASVDFFKPCKFPCLFHDIPHTHCLKVLQYLRDRTLTSGSPVVYPILSTHFLLYFPEWTSLNFFTSRNSALPWEQDVIQFAQCTNKTTFLILNIITSFHCF